jgi:ubiquinone/menaquinone biosynthesis C-methylase UbiE
VNTAALFDDSAARRLEAVYLTPDVVRQRREVLRMLAPEPGQRVLDVGSGPGILLQELAERVRPGGQATGIDVSDSMLAVARRRQEEAAAHLTMLKADAGALPFAAGLFDAAVSVQVYEYVDDVAAALLELHRVLRPGGRVVILDTDWDSIVWNARDRRLMARVLSAWVRRFAHPDLPRTLSRQLRDAGFGVERIETLVVFNPSYDPGTYSAAHVEIVADFVAATSHLTPDDLSAWRDDLRSLGEEGRYFFSLTRFLFLAEKRP